MAVSGAAGHRRLPTDTNRPPIGMRGRRQKTFLMAILMAMRIEMPANPGHSIQRPETEIAVSRTATEVAASRTEIEIAVARWAGEKLQFGARRRVIIAIDGSWTTSSSFSSSVTRTSSRAKARSNFWARRKCRSCRRGDSALPGPHDQADEDPRDHTVLLGASRRGPLRLLNAEKSD
jgi:hypothetical protein